MRFAAKQVKPRPTIDRVIPGLTATALLGRQMPFSALISVRIIRWGCILARAYTADKEEGARRQASDRFTREPTGSMHA